MKRGWVLGLLALLVLPCSAQQIMYSNLKELVEGRGDTVTILKVEKRSKNQIYPVSYTHLTLPTILRV